MIELTDPAKNEILKYFEGKDISPIRVYIGGGCSGPQLALALDEKADTDESYDFGDDVSVIIDKQLLEQAKPISIHFSERGFLVDSPIELGGGCSSSGCGGCCG